MSHIEIVNHNNVLSIVLYCIVLLCQIAMLKAIFACASLFALSASLVILVLEYGLYTPYLA